LTAAMLGRFIGRGPAPSRTPADRLTDRELEVLELIGEGLSTGQIAARLFVSVKTVGTYREKLKEKLNLGSAAELNRYAALWCVAGGVPPGHSSRR
ncbi:MAG: response regulator transcription factor, partial [Deltaproteobacteria bacterium]|nr:response regulator transcription factor [Deltaproteobacteria bacterium]